MKGCRPFTADEFNAINKAFDGRYEERDRALFVVGYRTGFRVGELLSLQIKDVWDNGRILDRLQVQRRFMKKQVEGRTVPLHAEAKLALAPWLRSYLGFRQTPIQATPSFRPLVRSQAHVEDQALGAS